MATPNARPFLIGNTMCFQCRSWFVIRNPYYGTNPLCSACRASRIPTVAPRVPQLPNVTPVAPRVPQPLNIYRVAPVVPSLDPEWVMHANTTELRENDLVETSIDWKKFEYPLHSCEINEGYWEIQQGEPAMDVHALIDRDTLEKSKVYFNQVGHHDEDAWIFIIKRPDDIFMYFRASCDYTGFECRGGGIIRYSKNWKTFWEMCLDTIGRSYLKPSL